MRSSFVNLPVMSPGILIAIRFLLAKKRSMLMSLTGISFGVGFFIVAQAAVGGFEEFFIKTILGTDGAIRIEDRFQDSLAKIEAATSESTATNFFVVDRTNNRYVEGVEYPDKIIDSIGRLSNIASAASVLKGRVTVSSPLRDESAQVLGISINEYVSVSDLETQVIFGTIDSFRASPTGLLLGRKLADRLQSRVGDSIIMEARGGQKRFKVSAIFETGYADIDRVRIFMHLDQARSMLKEPHGVSFVQVSLFDRDLAFSDAATIERMTGHSAAPWQEREKVWLEVFKMLEAMSAIVISTIIFISGLGMFNTLAMIVMEKTREIAILRSMGYSRADISNIFLFQGAMVLIAGVVSGFMIGAGVTYGIARMPYRMRGIFSTDTFPVVWETEHYVYAALTAVVVVTFASLAPARRAARLIPGDVIRGTSA